MNLTDTTIENELQQTQPTQESNRDGLLFESSADFWRGLDHVFSRVTEFFIVAFALYLVAELLNAFATGAVERMVR